MLNYIWITLIALGILAAAGSDIADEAGNRYRNGVPFDAAFEVSKSLPGLHPSWEGTIVLSAGEYNARYGPGAADSTVRVPAVLTADASGGATVAITVGENSPARWKEMALHAAE
ncbi:MAG TPA: hypothetical protein VK569_08970, partial [Bacteroidota bacterium]|nr:hypothetical protein [Bacteroidota bacterium]